MTYLSVIVPVFNESKRLQGVEQISSFFKKKAFSTELVIVNDGSSDNTLARLKKLQKTYRFSLLTYYPNRGKGHAIKIGMLAAKGEYRLFMDIDLSTPLEEFDKFKDWLGKSDVVIGSRKVRSAKLIQRQNPIRENLGKVFTLMSQVVLRMKVTDFTCGFKCFSAKAASEIFSCSQIERWGFDSEILYLAKKRGFKIKEVPVTWRNDTNTKVKFPQDIIRSLNELFQIVINDLTGKYA